MTPKKRKHREEYTKDIIAGKTGQNIEVMLMQKHQSRCNKK